MLSKNKILLAVGGVVILALIALSPIPKLLALTAGLDGYAWSDGMGWIDATPSTSQVSINSETGALSGYAWGDNIGWVNLTGVTVGLNVDKTLTGAVSGAGYSCSVFASGCSGALRESYQTGGWDGKISMQNVRVSTTPDAEGKYSFSGHAWSDLNTMWINMTGWKFALTPTTDYILSVTKDTTDTTGVYSVSPVGLDKSAPYPPGTSVTLTAKNSSGANLATCWRDGTTVIDASSKVDTYTLTMNSNHNVVVGCGTGGEGTVTGGGNGNVAGNPCAGVIIDGTGPYTENDAVFLSLADSLGNGFMADWSTDNPLVRCTSPASSCSFTMPRGDVRVTISNCSAVPPGTIGTVLIKTGAYEGIVFAKQGGSPYPWASQPFKVEVRDESNNLVTTPFNLNFSWSGASTANGAAFPADCVGNIKIINKDTTCNSGTTGLSGITVNDAYYKLCFTNRCANTTTGYSRFNGTWNVGVTEGGNPLPTTVDGYQTKLRYSDATHQ